MRFSSSASQNFRLSLNFFLSTKRNLVKQSKLVSLIANIDGKLRESWAIFSWYQKIDFLISLLFKTEHTKILKK